MLFCFNISGTGWGSLIMSHWHQRKSPALKNRQPDNLQHVLCNLKRRCSWWGPDTLCLFLCVRESAIEREYVRVRPQMFVLPLLLLLAAHCFAWRQMAFVCCRRKCAFEGGGIMLSKLWLSPPLAPSQEMTSITVRLVTMAMPCLRMIVKLSFIHTVLPQGFLFVLCMYYFILSICISCLVRSTVCSRKLLLRKVCVGACVFVCECVSVHFQYIFVQAFKWFEIGLKIVTLWGLVKTPEHELFFSRVFNDDETLAAQGMKKVWTYELLFWLNHVFMEAHSQQVYVVPVYSCILSIRIVCGLDIMKECKCKRTQDIFKATCYSSVNTSVPPRCIWQPKPPPSTTRTTGW